MTTFTESTSNAAINKAIKSIATTAAKLNIAIHDCAVMCMTHAREYGDASGAARLVDAMPMSHRRSLLISWFGKNSPVTIEKNAKTGLMKAHLAGKAEERVWNIEAAKATPFFDMPEAAKEPEVPTFDGLVSNVYAFIAKTKKAAEAIKDADDKAHALALVENLNKVAKTA